MLIGNPLYDTVFKYLMEDTEIARRLISLLIGEEIVELHFSAQEHTAHKEVYPMALFRMDFVAKIKTADGEKNVLIEVQKARQPTDIVRFRSYLGKKYMEKEQDSEGLAYSLPIIAIYFLGYNLEGLEDAVIKVERRLNGIQSGQRFEIRHPFVENLTHDAYIVQVKRLRNRLQTPLDWALSIFDQQYRTEQEYLLNYPYEQTPEEVEQMIKRLQYIPSSEEMRQKLEDEKELELEYRMTYGQINKLRLQVEEQRQKLEAIEQQAEEVQQQAEEGRKKLQAAVLALIQNTSLSDAQIAGVVGVAEEFVQQLRASFN